MSARTATTEYDGRLVVWEVDYDAPREQVTVTFSLEVLETLDPLIFAEHLHRLPRELRAPSDPQPER